MANKNRKYNPNNRNGRQTQSAPRSITVKDKKRELVRERVHSDPVKSKGMRALFLAVCAILLSRAALFVYELVYYSYSDIGIGVVSNLLLLPLLIILYMANDGNRGLLSVTAISAVVRIIYLFSSVYPEVEKFGGSTAFVAVYAAVMALQFIMSVLALSMPSTDAYSKEMQKINFELRNYILNSRR